MYGLLSENMQRPYASCRQRIRPSVCSGSACLSRSLSDTMNHPCDSIKPLRRSFDATFSGKNRKKISIDSVFLPLRERAVRITFNKYIYVFKIRIVLPEPFHIFIPPFDPQQRLDLSIRKSIANMSRGHACDDFIRSHIFQYDSARSDNGAVADRHSRYDCCPRPIQTSCPILQLYRPDAFLNG